MMKQSIALTPKNFVELLKPTGNIYETVVIIAKRAKQIVVKTKEELDTKLGEFISHSDNAEEVFENKEHIEISKSYEKQPKPVIIATEEFLTGKMMRHYPEGVAPLKI
jgi:DNA-directed RNA polymerase subunit K/omega